METRKAALFFRGLSRFHLLLEKINQEFLTLGLVELIFVIWQVIFIPEKNVLAFRKLPLQSIVCRETLVVSCDLRVASILFMSCSTAQGSLTAFEIGVFVVG